MVSFALMEIVVREVQLSIFSPAGVNSLGQIIHVCACAHVLDPFAKASMPV